MRIALALISAALLAGHAMLGQLLHREKPELGLLPPRPTDTALEALSLGDKQYLYRAFVLQIQNAGDTGGRFTPMSMYDTVQVVSWLEALQKLDPSSNHYNLLAVRYFSHLQEPEDIRRLIDFVDRDIELDPERKWYWQTQIVALARDQLRDLPFAAELARKIENYEVYVPTELFWTLQMYPILLESMGLKDQARREMERVVVRYGARMDQYQRSWTDLFFQRLN